MKKGEIEMEGRQHVIDFLTKCIEYADASILRKQARGDTEEIPQWETYREFTRHALDEIQAGELNRWFPREDPTLQQETSKHDLGDMEHKARSLFLSNLVSPRPLVMLGTESNNGIRNLAPYTSVSIVANSPPLAVISLSVDRKNRVRDSLINLRENGKAVLNFLQPNQDNARLVEDTCKPIPRNESEWEAFSIDALESNHLIMKDASMAIEAEVVAEHDLPEAKACLVVLRLTQLIVPGEHLPNESVHLLCQHGLNRLMATPTAWDHNIDSNV